MNFFTQNKLRFFTARFCISAEKRIYQHQQHRIKKAFLRKETAFMTGRVCLSEKDSSSAVSFRSSRPEVFCKRGVLNFAKFTGKHLCQSFFFNKVACFGAPENKKGSLIFEPIFKESSVNKLTINMQNWKLWHYTEIFAFDLCKVRVPSVCQYYQLL